MDGNIMTFSPQQVAAIDAAGRWIKRGAREQQIFRLFGYAGTGKTTIAKHLAEGLDGEVVYAAFTGKAALMMQRHGCENASTIHSLIYRPHARYNGEVEFVLNRESDAAEAALIVVDECSMVDAELAQDLMSFGKPILVLGDPEQLPPVNGAGFFTSGKPDAMLTEIHRQAKNNPIILLATVVRKGLILPYRNYGQSKVVKDEGLELSEILAADQILVGKNQTRHELNASIRDALGRKSKMPEVGDRLVCLRNDHNLGIFNGGLFTVSKVPKYNSRQRVLNMEVLSEDFPDNPPLAIKVRREFFIGGNEDLDWSELRGTQRFNYGYALTTHKAQGSQWANVIIQDESAVFGVDRQRWLYTAITRAMERVTIVR